MPVAPVEHIPVRQYGRLAGAQIGEDDAAVGLYRVGGDTGALAGPPVLLLEGLLKALAGTVVLPAVVRAADLAALDKAVVQGHPAVRARLRDQRVGVLVGQIEHQVLAQHPDPLGPLVRGEIGGDGDGLPVPPQQVARRGTRTDAREKFVLGFTDHGHAPLDSAVPAAAWRRPVAGGRRAPRCPALPRCRRAGCRYGVASASGRLSMSGSMSRSSSSRYSQVLSSAGDQPSRAWSALR